MAFSRSLLIRITSFLLTVVYFTANCALSHAAEVNFWKERQNLNRSAQVSSPWNASIQGPQTVDPGLQSARMTDNFGIPLQFGSIRRITPLRSSSFAGQAKTIIHIQDIHLNREAQANIAGAVNALVKSGRVKNIFLEGGFGKTGLDVFREFPEPGVMAKVADAMLAENKIQGPIHAVLSNPSSWNVSIQDPHGPWIKTFQGDVVGIDDETHYNANVEAYRASAPLVKAEKEKLVAWKKDLAERKFSVLSAQLAAFDRKVETYRDGKITMGEYADEIATVRHGGPRNDNLNTFIESLQLERSLNLAQVESERSRLLQKLLPKLNADKTNQLSAVAAAFAGGTVSNGDFYRFIQNICRHCGINLADYKAMDAYIRYTLLSESIDGDGLIAELKSAEESAYAALAKTETEKILVAESRQAYLAGKLLDFALTKDEWGEYKQEVLSNQFSVLSKKHFLRTENFEAFYKEAEIRDGRMAENVLKTNSLRTENSGSVSVLVTGGFHSTGIDKRLTDAGYTVATFVPKISKVDAADGSAYLSVFTQEKTPLEKLFDGQKLFLSQKFWTPALADETAARALGTSFTERSKTWAARARGWTNLTFKRNTLTGSGRDRQGRALDFKINLDKSQIVPVVTGAAMAFSMMAPIWIAMATGDARFLIWLPVGAFASMAIFVYRNRHRIEFASIHLGPRFTTAEGFQLEGPGILIPWIPNLFSVSTTSTPGNDSGKPDEKWLRKLIPPARWEAGKNRKRTSGYPFQLQQVAKETWGSTSATYVDGQLTIQGRSVMEPWQKDYMGEFAKVVTKRGGRILELGFGLGLSARAIQQHDIEEHVIIEPNKDVYDQLVEYAKTSPHKITPVFGAWQDVIGNGEMFKPDTFDGIFFDASPFDERELHFRQFDFAAHAQRLLKPGGIYTYCNLSSLGRVKDFYDEWQDLFDETQRPHLEAQGFEDISFYIVPANPPEGHPKYAHKTAMVPIMHKPIGPEAYGIGVNQSKKAKPGPIKNILSLLAGLWTTSKTPNIDLADWTAPLITEATEELIQRALIRSGFEADKTNTVQKVAANLHGKIRAQKNPTQEWLRSEAAFQLHTSEDAKTFTEHFRYPGPFDQEFELDRLFPEPSVRFTSRTDAPQPLVMRFPTRLFDQGLITRETAQRIVDIASWQNTAGAQMPTKTRSGFDSLPGSIHANGLVFELAKIKNIGNEGAPVQMKAFQGSGGTLQPTVRADLDQNSNVVHIDIPAAPIGGDYLDGSLNEFTTQSIASANGIPTPLPIAVGQLLNTYDGKALGVVVMATIQNDEVRLWDQMIADEDGDGTSKVMRANKREVLAARTLGQLHRAGIVHRYPHLHQFHVADNRATIFDFTDATHMNRMTREQFIFGVMQDFTTLYGEVRDAVIMAKSRGIDSSAVLPEFITEYFGAFMDAKAAQDAANLISPNITGLNHVIRMDATVGRYFRNIPGPIIPFFETYAGPLYDQLKSGERNDSEPNNKPIPNPLLSWNIAGAGLVGLAIAGYYVWIGAISIGAGMGVLAVAVVGGVIVHELGHFIPAKITTFFENVFLNDPSAEPRMIWPWHIRWHGIKVSSFSRVPFVPLIHMSAPFYSLLLLWWVPAFLPEPAWNILHGTVLALNLLSLVPSHFLIETLYPTDGDNIVWAIEEGLNLIWAYFKTSTEAMKAAKTESPAAYFAARLREAEPSHLLSVLRELDQANISVASMVTQVPPHWRRVLWNRISQIKNRDDQGQAGALLLHLGLAPLEIQHKYFFNGIGPEGISQVLLSILINLSRKHIRMLAMMTSETGRIRLEENVLNIRNLHARRRGMQLLAEFGLLPEKTATEWTAIRLQLEPEGLFTKIVLAPFFTESFSHFHPRFVSWHKKKSPEQKFLGLPLIFGLALISLGAALYFFAGSIEKFEFTNPILVGACAIWLGGAVGQSLYNSIAAFQRWRGRAGWESLTMTNPLGPLHQDLIGKYTELLVHDPALIPQAQAWIVTQTQNASSDIAVRTLQEALNTPRVKAASVDFSNRRDMLRMFGSLLGQQIFPFGKIAEALLRRLINVGFDGTIQVSWQDLDTYITSRKLGTMHDHFSRTQLKAKKTFTIGEVRELPFGDKINLKDLAVSEGRSRVLAAIGKKKMKLQPMSPAMGALSQILNFAPRQADRHDVLQLVSHQLHLGITPNMTDTALSGLIDDLTLAFPAASAVLQAPNRLIPEPPVTTNPVLNKPPQQLWLIRAPTDESQIPVQEDNAEIPSVGQGEFRTSKGGVVKTAKANPCIIVTVRHAGEKIGLLAHIDPTNSNARLSYQRMKDGLLREGLTEEEIQQVEVTIFTMPASKINGKDLWPEVQQGFREIWGLRLSEKNINDDDTGRDSRTLAFDFESGRYTNLTNLIESSFRRVNMSEGDRTNAEDLFDDSIGIPLVEIMPDAGTSPTGVMPWTPWARWYEHSMQMEVEGQNVSWRKPSTWRPEAVLVAIGFIEDFLIRMPLQEIPALLAAAGTYFAHGVSASQMTINDVGLILGVYCVTKGFMMVLYPFVFKGRAHRSVYLGKNRSALSVDSEDMSHDQREEIKDSLYNIAAAGDLSHAIIPSIVIWATLFQSKDPLIVTGIVLTLLGYAISGGTHGVMSVRNRRNGKVLGVMSGNNPPLDPNDRVFIDIPSALQTNAIPWNRPSPLTLREIGSQFFPEVNNVLARRTLSKVTVGRSILTQTPPAETLFARASEAWLTMADTIEGELSLRIRENMASDEVPLEDIRAIYQQAIRFMPPTQIGRLQQTIRSEFEKRAAAPSDDALRLSDEAVAAEHKQLGLDFIDMKTVAAMREEARRGIHSRLRALEQTRRALDRIANEPKEAETPPKRKERTRVSYTPTVKRFPEKGETLTMDGLRLIMASYTPRDLKRWAIVLDCVNIRGTNKRLIPEVQGLVENLVSHSHIRMKEDVHTYLTHTTLKPLEWARFVLFLEETYDVWLKALPKPQSHQFFAVIPHGETLDTIHLELSESAPHSTDNRAFYQLASEFIFRSMRDEGRVNMDGLQGAVAGRQTVVNMAFRRENARASYQALRQAVGICAAHPILIYKLLLYRVLMEEKPTLTPDHIAHLREIDPESPWLPTMEYFYTLIHPSPNAPQPRRIETVNPLNFILEADEFGTLGLLPWSPIANWHEHSMTLKEEQYSRWNPYYWSPEAVLYVGGLAEEFVVRMPFQEICAMAGAGFGFWLSGGTSLMDPYVFQSLVAGYFAGKISGFFMFPATFDGLHRWVYLGTNRQAISRKTLTPKENKSVRADLRGIGWAAGSVQLVTAAAALYFKDPHWFFNKWLWVVFAGAMIAGYLGSGWVHGRMSVNNRRNGKTIGMGRMVGWRKLLARVEQYTIADVERGLAQILEDRARTLQPPQADEAQFAWEIVAKMLNLDPSEYQKVPLSFRQAQEAPKRLGFETDVEWISDRGFAFPIYTRNDHHRYFKTADILKIANACNLPRNPERGSSFIKLGRDDERLISRLMGTNASGILAEKTFKGKSTFTIYNAQQGKRAKWHVKNGKMGDLRTRLKRLANSAPQILSDDECKLLQLPDRRFDRKSIIGKNGNNEFKNIEVFLYRGQWACDAIDYDAVREFIERAIPLPIPAGKTTGLQHNGMYPLAVSRLKDFLIATVGGFPQPSQQIKVLRVIDGETVEFENVMDPNTLEEGWSFPEDKEDFIFRKVYPLEPIKDDEMPFDENSIQTLLNVDRSNQSLRAQTEMPNPRYGVSAMEKMLFYHLDGREQTGYRREKEGKAIWAVKRSLLVPIAAWCRMDRYAHPEDGQAPDEETETAFTKLATGRNTNVKDAHYYGWKEFFFGGVDPIIVFTAYNAGGKEVHWFVEGRPGAVISQLIKATKIKPVEHAQSIPDSMAREMQLGNPILSSPIELGSRGKTKIHLFPQYHEATPPRWDWCRSYFDREAFNYLTDLTLHVPFVRRTERLASQWPVSDTDYNSIRLNINNLLNGVPPENESVERTVKIAGRSVRFFNRVDVNTLQVEWAHDGADDDFLREHARDHWIVPEMTDELISLTDWAVNNVPESEYEQLEVRLREKIQLPAETLTLQTTLETERGKVVLYKRISVDENKLNWCVKKDEEESLNKATETWYTPRIRNYEVAVDNKELRYLGVEDAKAIASYLNDSLGTPPERPAFSIFAGIVFSVRINEREERVWAMHINDISALTGIAEHLGIPLLQESDMAVTQNGFLLLGYTPAGAAAEATRLNTSLKAPLFTSPTDAGEYVVRRNGTRLTWIQLPRQGPPRPDSHYQIEEKRKIPADLLKDMQSYAEECFLFLRYAFEQIAGVPFPLLKREDFRQLAALHALQHPDTPNYKTGLFKFLLRETLSMHDMDPTNVFYEDAFRDARQDMRQRAGFNMDLELEPSEYSLNAIREDIEKTTQPNINPMSPAIRDLAAPIAGRQGRSLTHDELAYLAQNTDRLAFHDLLGHIGYAGIPVSAEKLSGGRIRQLTEDVETRLEKTADTVADLAENLPDEVRSTPRILGDELAVASLNEPIEREDEEESQEEPGQLEKWIDETFSPQQKKILRQILRRNLEKNRGNELYQTVVRKLAVPLSLGILDWAGPNHADIVHRIAYIINVGELKRLLQGDDWDVLLRICRGNLEDIRDLFLQIHRGEFKEKDVEEILATRYLEIIGDAPLVERTANLQEISSAMKALHAKLETDPSATQRVVLTRMIRNLLYPDVERKWNSDPNPKNVGQLITQETAKLDASDSLHPIFEAVRDYYVRHLPFMPFGFNAEADGKKMALLLCQRFMIAEGVEALRSGEHAWLLTSKPRTGKTFIAVLAALNAGANKILLTSTNQGTLEAEEVLMRHLDLKKLNLEIILLTNKSVAEKKAAIRRARLSPKRVIVIGNYHTCSGYRTRLINMRPDAHIIDELENLRHVKSRLYAPRVYEISEPRAGEPQPMRIGIAARFIVKSVDNAAAPIHWLKPVQFPTVDSAKDMTPEQAFQAKADIETSWPRKVVMPDISEPFPTTELIPYGPEQDAILVQMRDPLSFIEIMGKAKKRYRSVSGKAIHLVKRTRERMASFHPGILFKDYKEIPPKIERALSLIEESLSRNGKVVVVIDFIEGIRLFSALVRKRFGINAPVTITSEQSIAVRRKRIERFRKYSYPKVLIGLSQQLGSSIRLYQDEGVSFHNGRMILLTRPDRNLHLAERLVGIGQRHLVEIFNLVSEFRNPSEANRTTQTVEQTQDKRLGEESELEELVAEQKPSINAAEKKRIKVRVKTMRGDDSEEVLGLSFLFAPTYKAAWANTGPTKWYRMGTWKPETVAALAAWFEELVWRPLRVEAPSILGSAGILFFMGYRLSDLSPPMLPTALVSYIVLKILFSIAYAFYFATAMHPEIFDGVSPIPSTPPLYDWRSPQRRELLNLALWNGLVCMIPLFYFVAGFSHANHQRIVIERKEKAQLNGIYEAQRNFIENAKPDEPLYNEADIERFRGMYQRDGQPIRTDIHSLYIDIHGKSFPIWLLKLISGARYEWYHNIFPKKKRYHAPPEETLHVSLCVIQDIPANEGEGIGVLGERKDLLSDRELADTLKEARETIESGEPFELKPIGIRSWKDGGMIFAFEYEPKLKTLQREIIRRGKKISPKFRQDRPKVLINITLFRALDNITPNAEELEKIKEFHRKYADVRAFFSPKAKLTVPVEKITYAHETRWMHTEIDQESKIEIELGRSSKRPQPWERLTFWVTAASVLLAVSVANAGTGSIEYAGDALRNSAQTMTPVMALGIYGLIIAGLVYVVAQKIPLSENVMLSYDRSHFRRPLKLNDFFRQQRLIAESDQSRPPMKKKHQVQLDEAEHLLAKVFQENHPGSFNWFAAGDFLANVYLEEQRFPEGIRILEDMLALCERFKKTGDQTLIERTHEEEQHLRVTLALLYLGFAEASITKGSIVGVKTNTDKGLAVLSENQWIRPELADNKSAESVLSDLRNLKNCVNGWAQRKGKWQQFRDLRSFLFPLIVGAGILAASAQNLQAGQVTSSALNIPRWNQHMLFGGAACVLAAALVYVVIARLAPRFEHVMFSWWRNQYDKFGIKRPRVRRVETPSIPLPHKSERKLANNADLALGLAALKEDRFQEAERYLGNIFEADTAGAKRWFIAGNALGKVFMHQQRFDEGISLLNTLLAFCERHQSDNNPDLRERVASQIPFVRITLAEILRIKAKFLSANGQDDSARQQLAHAEQILTKDGQLLPDLAKNEPAGRQLTRIRHNLRTVDERIAAAAAPKSISSTVIGLIAAGIIAASAQNLQAGEIASSALNVSHWNLQMVSVLAVYALIGALTYVLITRGLPRFEHIVLMGWNRQQHGKGGQENNRRNVPHKRQPIRPDLEKGHGVESDAAITLGNEALKKGDLKTAEKLLGGVFQAESDGTKRWFLSGISPGKLFTRQTRFQEGASLLRALLTFCNVHRKSSSSYIAQNISNKEPFILVTLAALLRNEALSYSRKQDYGNAERILNQAIEVLTEKGDLLPILVGDKFAIDQLRLIRIDAKFVSQKTPRGQDGKTISSVLLALVASGIIAASAQNLPASEIARPAPLMRVAAQSDAIAQNWPIKVLGVDGRRMTLPFQPVKDVVGNANLILQVNVQSDDDVAGAVARIEETAQALPGAQQKIYVPVAANAEQTLRDALKEANILHRERVQLVASANGYVANDALDLETMLTDMGLNANGVFVGVQGDVSVNPATLTRLNVTLMPLSRVLGILAGTVVSYQVLKRIGAYTLALLAA